MKKIILPLLFCFFMVSCASTRKSVHTSCTSVTNTESSENSNQKTESVVDTTKTESGKITITEIEFYPPTNDLTDGEDTVNNITTSDETKVKNSKATNVGDIYLPNVGSIKNAAIKSIKQTTIESELEQKGESKETNESDKSKSESIISKTSQFGVEEITPAPDPYRWRYIFYILLVVSIWLLYLKRVPILNWIKTILSGIRRIF